MWKLNCYQRDNRHSLLSSATNRRKTRAAVSATIATTIIVTYAAITTAIILTTITTSILTSSPTLSLLCGKVRLVHGRIRWSILLKEILVKSKRIRIANVVVVRSIEHVITI